MATNENLWHHIKKRAASRYCPAFRVETIILDVCTTIVVLVFVAPSLTIAARLLWSEALR